MAEGIFSAAEGLTAGFAFVDVLPRFKEFSAEARAEVQKAASGIEGEAARAFAGVGRAATFAVIGAAVGIGVASIEMADKFEAQHARLETALHNVGLSFEAEKSKVDAIDKSMERLGYTNTQTEGSLASLVLVTKNMSRARADEALAADIARGRNIDLAAATGILVKVETGHVGLLGRLGINTKDATGATISQEEAIKRLTALYGGNASAYADTFAGKMQVLRATSEDLGKNIGLRLIPVLKTMATAGLAVVTWLEHHHAAAYALGVVIGGPLVAAMATYVALEAKALAMNVVGFFSGVADAAAAAIGPLLGLDAAVAGIGFTEIGVAAPAAAGGFLAVAGAVGAVALPLAAAAGGVLLYNKWLDESDKKQTTWAQTVVKAAAASNNANQSIAAERAKLTTQLRAEQAKEQGYVSGDQTRTQQNLEALNKEWKKHQEVVSKAAKDAARDHAASSAAISGDATAVASAATAEGKAMAKAVADLTASVGPNLASIDVAAGYSVDQLKNITKESNSTASAIAGSFNSSTSVVQKFGAQAKVSFKEVNRFFKDQVAAARDWSGNISKLTAAGIDQGLLKQLAEAGPKAAPLVAALLKDVQAGNLAAINQAQADLRTILGNTIGLVNSYDNNFYATGVSNGAAYANGFNSAAANARVAPVTRSGEQSSGGGSRRLAKGGFIDHPQLIFAGEESRREVVLPLEDRARSFELLAQSGLFSQPYNAGSSSAAPTGASRASASEPEYVVVMDGEVVGRLVSQRMRGRQVAHS